MSADIPLDSFGNQALFFIHCAEKEHYQSGFGFQIARGMPGERPKKEQSWERIKKDYG